MAFARSLSGRLLIVALLAVLVMEVLIFAPSLARFRADFLAERLRMAEVASLAILATPEGMLDPELEAALLDRAGATSIVLRRGGVRGLVLNAADPRPVERTYDLRDPPFWTLMRDAAASLAAAEGRHVRVIGRPDPAAPDEVEITFDDGALTAAARAFSLRILGLSLAIALTAAGVIYLLAQRLLVSPMARIVRCIMDFSRDPEDPARVIRPTSRVTELAEAEQALAAMQTDLRAALRQRARLAALGEAVAKVSHDLRNMLSTAQLMADRIETSRDPLVARIGPKLVASLDRAVTLCQSTLRYGSAEEATPEPRRVALARLVAEVADAVFPDRDEAQAMRCENRVDPDLVVTADPDQLFRILSNLVRNARQAIEATGRGGLVAVSARVEGAMALIEVADDGPGLPARALENLFQPFRGGARRGGHGLGLAIAHDLAQMQGGALTLVGSTTAGTTFRVAVPL